MTVRVAYIKHLNSTHCTGLVYKTALYFDTDNHTSHDKPSC